MSVKREFRKSERTPEQLAELRAVRERYQREKPTPEEVLKASGQAEFVALGEVIFLHQVLALLKKERERQGLTLASLEERTGISQAALSRLENGKTDNPTLETIYRVAAGLGKAISCELRDITPTTTVGNAAL